MKDGILESEREDVQRLINLTVWYDVVGPNLYNKYWVKDGMNDDDSKALQLVEWLAYRAGAETTAQVLRMPFLYDLDPVDVHALASLRRLAAFAPDQFTEVMALPAVADGIDDNEALVVSTLYATYKHNPFLAFEMLDAGTVSVDERLVHLPVSGKTRLSIMRTGPRVHGTMDTFEEAARFVEEYMQTPFPTGQLTTLIADAAVFSFGGTHFGTHMVIDPKYEAGERTQYLKDIFVHEVAHYYWSGYEDWIDEGAATFIESLALGTPDVRQHSPCTSASNIADWLRLDSEQHPDAGRCKYSLGERIFYDMYRALGDGPFRKGLQILYQRHSSYWDGEEWVYPGIDAFRESFKAVERTGSNVVDPVINRWYYGTQ